MPPLHVILLLFYVLRVVVSGHGHSHAPTISHGHSHNNVSQNRHGHSHNSHGHSHDSHNRNSHGHSHDIGKWDIQPVLVGFMVAVKCHWC